MNLEICTDASIRTFENGRVFSCSGAICINNAETSYVISPDSTNSRGELLAIYLGCKLAHKMVMENPNIFTDIILYSDSQFAIFGLTRWMNSWIKNSSNGIMYGSNKKPVKNQNLFKSIITYLITSGLVVHMRHQAGHVNYHSNRMLAKANATFKQSNGYLLKPEDIYKISYYNDLIDKSTRDILYNESLNPNEYPIMHYNDEDAMCNYVIPSNYKDFVL